MGSRCCSLVLSVPGLWDLLPSTRDFPRFGGGALGTRRREFTLISLTSQANQGRDDGQGTVSSPPTQERGQRAGQRDSLGSHQVS